MRTNKDIYRNTAWQNDIDTFTQWKNFLELVHTDEVRERVIGYLKRIQAKWPNHIGADEIPEA